MAEKKWINETEVEKITGISKSTLQKDRFYGRGFPYIKRGKTVRYDLSDIVAEMDRHRINPQAK